MSDFQKSSINFSFQDASWAVVKYNEHVAHRQVEKVFTPIKAVDFMGMHGETLLFLIEVKKLSGIYLQ